MSQDPQYAIGTRFIPNRKIEREETIIDIHKTFNSKGEQVKFRYVTSHEFCGQIVTDDDVCQTTIARGQVTFEPA
jgi:hypothetical protein